MKRTSVALIVAFALFGPARAEEKFTEEGILAELKKLAGRPAAKETVDLDAEELKELLEKRGKRALELIKKFEAEHPKSKSLNDARLDALKAISVVDDLATEKEPIALAKRLRAATQKGTDHAAQADMFLVAADIRLTLRAAKSSEDFAKAWNRNAETFRRKIKAYLEDHPKYLPAADALRGLVPLLDLAGDTKTRDLILESVAKNLPDHPLAKAQALRKMVGNEFDLKFIPVGKEKEESLKGLRGKVVVINFWASWCVPCAAEMRQLKGLYEKHHKEGLEIVGFGLDEKEGAAQRFLKKHQPAWRQVIGKQALAVGEKYGIETVPVQLVIDREGKLVTVDALGKLQQLLPKLLEEKK
jgi:thiol-disulfide isomerase/thioredoxin